MSDFENLRVRVEATAERLAETQKERRHRNQSLLDTIARLEGKFAAQEQEVAFYRDRVRPLEVANAQLRDLMGRLLDMVDAGFDETSERDPVRQATSMAAQMLDRDMLPVAEAAAEDFSAMFEETDRASLDAELAEADDGEDLPAVVDLARAAAADADADPVDALADIFAPAPSRAERLQPTAEDIRTLLERVEAAAARVNAAADPVPPQSAPPVRRISGAAA
jgi:hypothetical protein